jgi:phosphoribosylamine--glycine ligase
MKILVIGGGGREHALVWKIRQHPEVEEVFCAPGNPGIAALADCLPIDPTNLVELADFAEKLRIDLTVVGPEVPLTMGIVDEFLKRGLRVFGPSSAAAELEGSKAFAKEFLARHDIPTAAYKTFTASREALSYLKSREVSYPVVLKVDGLAAGKGVLVAADHKEAAAFATDVLDGHKHGSAGDRLVIEEFLEGVEASFFALSDGKRVVPLVACQDYKQLGDGDTGPNTGGMGTVSPPAIMDQGTFSRTLQEIILPTVSGMDAEGRTYRGVLYAGLMITDQGPKVLEFNARFGDPETQVLMPRLQSDLVGPMLASAEGRLQDVKLEWRSEACACVVLASGGYPGAYEKGFPIAGLDQAEALDSVNVFHAGTRRDGEQIVTQGGRVLGVTALGADLPAALERAYQAVDTIQFQGKTFRRDIGYRPGRSSSKDE